MPSKKPLPLSGIHILVVDDNEDIRNLMQMALEHYGAFVVLAGSARQGLAELQKVIPDVILADLAMPDEDGFWFIREVRKLTPEGGGMIPTIAFTAYGNEHEHLALAAGFNACLLKPVHLDEVCAVIQKLASEKADGNTSTPGSTPGLASARSSGCG